MRAKLTHPLVLGFFASLAFTVLVVTSGINWGFDLGEIFIAIGAVAAGSGVGAYLAWKLTKGIRGGRKGAP